MSKVLKAGGYPLITYAMKLLKLKDGIEKMQKYFKLFSVIILTWYYSYSQTVMRVMLAKINE
jgi:hypothetical protein